MPSRRRGKVLGAFVVTVLVAGGLTAGVGAGVASAVTTDGVTLWDNQAPSLLQQNTRGYGYADDPISGAGAAWVFRVSSDWEAGDTFAINVAPGTPGGVRGENCATPVEPEEAGASASDFANYIGFVDPNNGDRVSDGPILYESTFTAGEAPMVSFGVDDPIGCSAFAGTTSYETLLITLENDGNGNPDHTAEIIIGKSFDLNLGWEDGPVLFDVGFGATTGPAHFTGYVCPAAAEDCSADTGWDDATDEFAVASSVTVVGQRPAADDPPVTLYSSGGHLDGGPISELTITEDVVNALPPAGGYLPDDLPGSPGGEDADRYLRTFDDPQGAVCLTIDNSAGNSVSFGSTAGWVVDPDASASPNSARPGPGAVALETAEVGDDTLRLPVQDSSNNVPTVWTTEGLALAGAAPTAGPVYAWAYYVYNDDDDFSGGPGCADVWEQHEGQVSPGVRALPTQLGYVQLATVYDGWTARTAPESAWESVAYGNGRFVAVASEGAETVMWSDDGETWTPAPAPPGDWQEVTFGNGRFVAVGDTGGTVITSLDGETWEAVSAPAGTWWSVTYGADAGRFVAVGWGDDMVMSSPDGITWTRHAAPEVPWQSVTHGEGRFVAVPVAGNVVMTSTDGITWVVDGAPGGKWQSVTHGDGQFVAVGWGPDRVMTSPDGIEWTAGSAPDGAWQSVTYGSGRFVAVEPGMTDPVMSSPDGIDWTIDTAPGSEWVSVAFGGGRFVAVSPYQPHFVMDWGAFDPPVLPTLDSFTPASGTTGTPVTITGTNLADATAVTFNGTPAVTFSAPNANEVAALVPSGATTGPIAVTTPAGTAVSADPFIATNTVPAPEVTGFSPSADNVGGLVTITGSGFTGFTGPLTVDFDGATATEVTVVADDQLTAVVPAGATTGPIAVTTPGGSAASVTDFTVFPNLWTARTAPSGSWRSLTYGNGRFVAVATSGANAVMTSPNGETWTPRSAPDGTWYSVTYGNGRFVAVGWGGTNRVMTSPNGETWTPRSAPAGNWYAVTYGNGRFVAVGSSYGGGYVAMTSTDGIDWTPAAAPGNSWNAVAYGNGTFVAVGSGGTMTSVDGASWEIPETPAPWGSWVSITYGNGVFVAADAWGSSTGIMTSPDGTSWTERTTPTSPNNLLAIAYGNGKYYAVGPNYLSAADRVLTSTNAIDWVSRSTQPGTWSAIAFAGGRFVAVANQDWGSTPNNAMTEGSYTAPPLIASVSPASGPVGTLVTITGTNLTGATGVAFNGTAAVTVTPVSATQVTAVVPAGATSGKITVTAPNGNGTSATDFTVTPAITSFSPTSGPVGTLVTITGTNLTGATAVAFDGTASEIVTPVSATQVTAVVPEGATTGPITVTAPNGSATSATDFTITSPVASTRTGGADELDTSILISQAAFPTLEDDADDESAVGSDALTIAQTTASAVVLARNDFFADALTGGPLAATVNGPLLLTYGAPTSRGARVPDKVMDEIDRLIDEGQTVYVLGGRLAISDGVVDDLEGAGYEVVRLWGVDQFATAVEIADEIESLDPPSRIFEATGYNFPDALSAVPAAIQRDGVILLTRDNVQSAETQAFIDDHDDLPRTTIGGDLVAGGADPDATNVSGDDLYETSAAVAATYFRDPDEVGIATGTNFPDALSGGVFMATGGRMGPMLLVDRTVPLPAAIEAYLETLGDQTVAFVFGGRLAVSNSVVDAVVRAIRS